MSEKFDNMSHVFTQEDIADFKRIEKEIETDQASFLRVADNLIEVRDRKLYGIVADTFEDYVRDRWGWSKQRAYQLISAKRVVDSLPEYESTIVDSESKARALAPVPPKRRMRVIHDAVEVSTNGKPTARDISEAAERYPDPPKPTPPPAKLAAPDVIYDKTGFPVPENLVKLFERSAEVKEVLSRISSIRGLLARVEETKDWLWQPVNKSMTTADLDRVYYELKMAMPYVVCPYCQGREETKSHCTSCKQRGILSQHVWDNAVPAELKAVREKSCKK